MYNYRDTMANEIQSIFRVALDRVFAHLSGLLVTTVTAMSFGHWDMDLLPVNHWYFHAHLLNSSNWNRFFPHAVHVLHNIDWVFRVDQTRLWDVLENVLGNWNRYGLFLDVYSLFKHRFRSKDFVFFILSLLLNYDLWVWSIHMHWSDDCSDFVYRLWNIDCLVNVKLLHDLDRLDNSVFPDEWFVVDIFLYMHSGFSDDFRSVHESRNFITDDFDLLSKDRDLMDKPDFPVYVVCYLMYSLFGMRDYMYGWLSKSPDKYR